jgi:CheY-like chemotaxis protein
LVADPKARRRILVVDDSEDSATMLVELLELWGHEARAAHDGPSAIQAAREWAPDLILLDIGLPGMNGYAVAKALREESSLREVTLVALTGYGRAADREDSKEAGFNHHLVKPVDLDALQQLVDR